LRLFTYLLDIFDSFSINIFYAITGRHINLPGQILFSTIACDTREDIAVLGEQKVLKIVSAFIVSSFRSNNVSK
jgi:hypothetical protein